MFPLEMVLFPNAPLSLHLFEPRYRTLAESCLQGDGRFGVVLIARGSSVGGGDSRYDAGTIARIVEAARTPDGRYFLSAIGTDRFRVRRWLEDDPFPRAEIDVLTEPPWSEPFGPARRDSIERLLVKVHALRGELGHPSVPAEATHLDSDPIRASFQASYLAPISPIDAQRLLELANAGERLEQVEQLLVEQTALLEFRLSGGGDVSR
jgi:Lon protease-like protein